MEMKNIVLTLLLLMQGIFATAQNGIVGAGGYNMSYIGMSEGLPSNSIQDIFEDSFGFMWIASDVGGLVRYDGYSFLHLSSGAYGQLLRSNSCRNLCEDRFGRLWVAFDEGVDVLDLKTLRTVMPQDLALAKASVAPLSQGKEQDASQARLCRLEGMHLADYRPASGAPGLRRAGPDEQLADPRLQRACFRHCHL